MIRFSPSAHGRSRSRPAWLWPLCVFVLLATASFHVARHQATTLQEREQAAFRHDIDLFVRELSDRLKLHDRFLRTLGAYFSARPQVGNAEWQRFVAGIEGEDNLPGIMAFGFAPRVTAGDIDGFEDEARRHGATPDYRIFPRSPSGATAFPVLAVAPADTTVRGALGFDMGSEAIRRRAIELAATTGDTVLSGRITLVFDSAQPKAAFLMFRPVFHPGRPTATAQERQAALAGVVFAAYRVNEFLLALEGRVHSRLALEILDRPADAGEDEALPFYDSGDGRGNNGQGKRGEASLAFGHRQWLLRFAEIESDGAPAGQREPRLILLGGLTTAALLAFGIYLLVSQRQRAERYARSTTADLRRAEAVIRANDKFKQEILDAATEVAIIATDGEGTITLFNRGAEKMLGYSAGDVVGKLTPAAFHLPEEIAERSQVLTAEHHRPIAGFAVFTVVADLVGHETRDWTYRRRDGSPLRVSLNITTQRDIEGRITGYLGIAIDISERLQAEAEGQRQHAQLQTILAHLPVGVSLIDRDLKFTAANQRLRDILDFPDELFAAGPPSFRDVALFNARRGEYGPGDPETLADAVVARASSPRCHRFERRRPNGKVIEVSGTPLPEGGFVTIYTDITERKQADEELRQHRDHLQEMVEARTTELAEALRVASSASQAKSEFLANMSHELRTPMHAILSFSGLGLERSALPGQEKLHQYFERIRQSAERLLGLVNDLLDLSRLETRHARPALRDIDLLPLLARVASHLESLLPAKRLQLSIASEARSTRLLADEPLVERLAHNLLANAIKFSPEGGRIAVRIQDASLPGLQAGASASGNVPALAMVFSDAGVGIPEDELAVIFDKFVQSSRTKSGAGGTGLGLAICREIVHAHHGTIGGSNNPAGGAVFTVTLPIGLTLEAEQQFHAQGSRD